MKKIILLICMCFLTACASSGMGSPESIKSSLTPAVFFTSKTPSELFYCISEKIETHGFTVNSRISPDNKSGQLYSHLDYLGRQITSIYSLNDDKLEVRAAKLVWSGWKSEVNQIARECI